VGTFEIILHLQQIFNILWTQIQSFSSNWGINIWGRTNLGQMFKLTLQAGSQGTVSGFCRSNIKVRMINFSNIWNN